jgi:ferredoxin
VTDIRLGIDREICAGHRRCYSMHPDLFAADDAGYPVVLEPAVGPDDMDYAGDAVDNCPEGAITLNSSQNRSRA